MMLSFDEIQKKVNELGAKINIHYRDLHIFAGSPGDGRPHITFDDNQYNYVHAERGFEFSRKVTSSLDELLYWIMSDFVHGVSFQYELKHRIENRDGRRIAFPMIVDLMGELNPAWKLRAQNEIDETLSRSPYDDKQY
ncbi:Imm63 family immunity protein [Xenorhabdus sp. SF857]|uniref:Imm63 family immunity protein n=1 Tax=Xenorhabdus bakwenae TaxID=3026967 RepID=UPI0025583249|nr:Imm63 family immunity protein [Xenorhabdus sp. SF857]WFQ79990.1 Imm63 family immunity protein [Xenorhabdus sp. SF857]